MTTLLIATRNAHKVREICQILSHNLEYRTLNDYPGAPAVVEDADTFEGNARKKSVELARWLASLPERVSAGEFYVLADDSGLEVDVLQGRPGVYSARFAAAEGAPADGNSPDAANNAKLLRLLKDTPAEKRAARFRCVLALTEIARGAVRQTIVEDGACEGRIAFAPSGKNGFGYDPLFVPQGYSQSFAELGEEVKNTLSHRARALEKLRLRLR